MFAMSVLTWFRLSPEWVPHDSVGALDGFWVSFAWILNGVAVSLNALCTSSEWVPHELWMKSWWAQNESWANPEWLRNKFWMRQEWIMDGSRMNSEWALDELLRNLEWVPNGILMGSAWVPNGFGTRNELRIRLVACRTRCLQAWIPRLSNLALLGARMHACILQLKLCHAMGQREKRERERERERCGSVLCCRALCVACLFLLAVCWCRCFNKISSHVYI